MLLGGCLEPLPSMAGELRKPGQGLRDRSDTGQLLSPACENFHSFSGCLLHDVLCLGLPVSSLCHRSQPPHNQGCLSKGAQTHSVRSVVRCSSQSTHVGMRACRAGCKRLDCIWHLENGTCLFFKDLQDDELGLIEMALNQAFHAQQFAQTHTKYMALWSC